MSEHTENPFEQSESPPAIPPSQSSTSDATASSPTPARLVRSQSPSPSPSAAAINDNPPTPHSNDERERETVNDPRVVALRAMFPDYDDLILQSVLQSVDGNQDRAIDALLGMSDPDYRSEAPAPVAPQAPTFSQEELDEQFARQLALQDQQQETEQWVQAHGGARPPPAVYQSTRPNARQGWSLQPAEGQDRPGEFQEQLSKFAETGKKTIGNIFSKVKAKIQEFEQGRPVTGQGSEAQQQGWNPPPTGGYVSPPQSQQQQPAYYDPNPQLRTSGPTRISPPTEGYDVSGPAVSPSPPIQTTTSQLRPESSLQPITVPPPQPGPTLDGGKLGLLPKRPVTLLRDPAAPSNASGAPGGSTTPAATANPVYHDDDDDYDGDDLEYAENPFESEHTGSSKK